MRAWVNLGLLLIKSFGFCSVGKLYNMPIINFVILRNYLQNYTHIDLMIIQVTLYTPV